jgi:2-methylcitrate dehydratase PrpD
MQTGDRIQSLLSSYAAGLSYEQLDDETVHAAKVRVIDTFGALIGGFAGDPCRIARDVAAQMPNPNGAPS